MTLPSDLVPPVIPATLAAALAQSVVAPIFCVTTTCGKFEPVWTFYGSNATYYVSQGDQVTAVQVNGVALTAAPDLATCLATPGTFFWYFGPALCYVHLLDETDPNARGNVVETFLTYRFSDLPSDAGGFWWEPRLINLPSLSWRLPADFRGLTQVGGGTLTLANEDHFFDTRMKQNWDAGTTTIQMGAAGLAFGSFQTIAAFSNFQPMLDDKNFMLAVRERKTKLDNIFPLTVYDQVAFPLIDPAAIGLPIQQAYGTLIGVTPVCINTAGLVFQVAGHAIKGFDGVRVLNSTTGNWDIVNFLSTNTAAATFTMNSVDWTFGKKIVVDFRGKKRADGSLMDGPSEIAADIITAMGEAVNTSAFETARLWYDAGYRGNDVTDRFTVHSPSYYFNKQVNALAALESMMVFVRAYLVVDTSNKFKMIPFRTYQASGLSTVTDIDMLGTGLKREVQVQQNRITQCFVTFAQKVTEGINSATNYQRVLQQFTRGAAQPISLTLDAPFQSQADADYLAQATVNDYNVDPVLYSCKVKWAGFTWTVGQHIALQSTRHSLNVVAEILDVNLDVTNRTVDLKLGNLRGNDESMGFWILSTDLTPAGASMAWADDAEIQYRRHNSGHWHNSKDQATDTPAGAQDWTTARWL